MTIYKFFQIFQMLTVVVGVLIGATRGAGKSLVRLVELALAGVASFFLSRFLAPLLTAPLMGFLVDLLSKDAPQLMTAAGDVEALVTPLVAALLVPCLFAAFFEILRFFSLVGFDAFAANIITLITKKEQAPLTMASRVGGAAVGLVNGAIVAMIVLNPVFAYYHVYLNIPEQTRISMAAPFGFTEEQLASVSGEETEFAPNTAFAALMTETAVGDAAYSATEEAPKLVSFVYDTWSVYGKSTEAGANPMKGFGDAFAATSHQLSESILLPHFTGTLMNGFGVYLQEHDLELSENPLAGSFLKSLSQMLIQATPENVADNIVLICGDGSGAEDSIMDIFSDCIEDGSDMKLSDMAGKMGEMSAIMDVAGTNENTQPTQDLVKDVCVDAFREKVLTLKDSGKVEKYLGYIQSAYQRILEQQDALGGSFSEKAAASRGIILETLRKKISQDEAELLSFAAAYFFTEDGNFDASQGITLEDVAAFFGLDLSVLTQ